MDWTTIVVAALGVIGTVGGAYVTHQVGRRRRVDDAAQITATAAEQAHGQILGAYSEFFDDMRTDFAAAREEARSARMEAREASRRAADAEVAAEASSRDLHRAVELLRDLRPLIEAYVPNSEAFLARLDRLAHTPAKTAATP